MFFKVSVILFQPSTNIHNLLKITLIFQLYLILCIKYFNIFADIIAVRVFYIYINFKVKKKKKKKWYQKSDFRNVQKFMCVFLFSENPITIYVNQIFLQGTEIRLFSEKQSLANL